MVGLGANPPEDAIYPLAVGDADGQPVMAENRYVLHFDKDELPPVGAFWSQTLYDAEGFYVANPLNRFALGDRDALKSMPTAHSISTSRTRAPARPRNPIGCRHRGAASLD